MIGAIVCTGLDLFGWSVRTFRNATRHAGLIELLEVGKSMMGFCNGDTEPIERDASYIEGRLDAVCAILLGVAGAAMTRAEFREESLARLTMLKESLAESVISEQRMQAIDDVEKWLRDVTK